MIKRKIKLFDPKIDSTEKRNMQSVFDSQNWASGGGSKFVNLFEKKFILYTGAKSGIAVNSGTAALHLAVSSIVKEKGEIIVPSLSFVSTAHCVKYSGHKVIFSDIDPLTGCIDPIDIEKKITEKTKAILPVHFGGYSSNLKKISNIAKTFDIPIIEDASHAAGTTYQKKKIGSHSDLVCFSFHPVKNLAMPSGGFICINSKNNSNLKNSLQIKKWCGITDRIGSNYDVKDLGWNYYMNEFSAAIGLAQLSKLNKLNKFRRNVAKEYFKRINVDFKMPYDNSCSYHFYWILVSNREQIRKKLDKLGIETGTHYKPIHKMSYYDKKIYLHNTENFSNQIITLPTHPNLSKSDVDYIIENINKII
jgi:perosamine synthetase